MPKSARHLNLDDELVARVDAVRGDVPRSRWISRAIEEALTEKRDASELPEHVRRTIERPGPLVRDRRGPAMPAQTEDLKARAAPEQTAKLRERAAARRAATERETAEARAALRQRLDVTPRPKRS